MAKVKNIVVNVVDENTLKMLLEKISRLEQRVHELEALVLS